MAKMKNSVGAAASSYAPKGEVPYEVEDDVRTLHRANKIRKDPKRHAAAKAHAKTLADQHMAVAKGDAGASGGAPDKVNGPPVQD